MADKVLILTPVKNAASYLPRHIELLRTIDHDPACVSIGFLDGDSDDGTYDRLADQLDPLRARFRRVELLRHDYGFRHDKPRWAPEIQRRRRDILARSRNRLLAATLRDEDWVLWLDVDLIAYPPDLIGHLIEPGEDIVVPHCVRPDGRTFDLNTFRLASGGREDARHLVDGLFQPPQGVGRLYLDSFQGEPIVAVDAVGGTALLIRADLHRDGLRFPAFSYHGYGE
ncbi:MAG: glycosyltransferase family 2 protein, partial [Alphaproteobacteria bacterium]|nr:glycosyltransferase family 2 protein [Alphaproteobacteria bacterium]